MKDVAGFIEAEDLPSTSLRDSDAPLTQRSLRFEGLVLVSVIRNSIPRRREGTSAGLMLVAVHQEDHGVCLAPQESPQLVELECNMARENE